MNNLGIGVMLKHLCGNEDSVNAYQSSVNKKIQELSLGPDDALHFVFEDGTKMKLFDDGQSCCESRYMTTDDDLSYFVGSILLDVEIKDGPDVEDEYEVHEIQFLEIKTDKGSFQMASHNVHNGYYGGFAIVAELE